MAHPSSEPIPIVGISESDRDRSCENHTCCGRSLELDSVVRFKYCQVLIDEEEETAIEVVSIRGGLDSCRVGFLKRHYIEDNRRLDGQVAQIVAFHRDADNQIDKDFDFYQHGACYAAILNAEYYEVLERLQNEAINGNDNDNNDNNGDNNNDNNNGNDNDNNNNNDDNNNNNNNNNDDDNNNSGNDNNNDQHYDRTSTAKKHDTTKLPVKRQLR